MGVKGVSQELLAHVRWCPSLTNSKAGDTAKAVWGQKVTKGISDNDWRFHKHLYITSIFLLSLWAILGGSVLTPYILT